MKILYEHIDWYKFQYSNMKDEIKLMRDYTDGDLMIYITKDGCIELSKSEGEDRIHICKIKDFYETLTRFLVEYKKEKENK